MEGNPLNEVGTITVNTEDGKLKVHVETHEGLAMSKADLAVAEDVEKIPQNNGGPIPGLHPFKAEMQNELKTGYTFEVDLEGTYPPRGSSQLKDDYYWKDRDKLYIALHVDLYYTEPREADGMVTWELTKSCPYLWEEGSDGYWYYCQPVAPGASVQLCLTGTARETGVYQVHLEAEAIQASKRAIESEWKNAPCLSNNYD